MNKLPEGLDGNIEIVRMENAEGDKNRGWQADVINVLVDGHPAGFICTLYIPQDRFERYYPNGAWDYFRIVNGINIPKIPDPSSRKDFAQHRIYIPDYPDKEKTNVSRKKEVEFFVQKFNENKRIKNQWDNFLLYNVNRPKTDFIRIYDADETDYRVWKNDQKSGEKRKSKIDFSRLALAPLLYREMAIWMSERGLNLYSSGLIEPEAIQAWKRMAEQLPKSINLEDRAGIVENNPNQNMYVLNGKDLNPWAPDWAKSLTRYYQNGHKEVFDNIKNDKTSNAQEEIITYGYR